MNQEIRTKAVRSLVAFVVAAACIGFAVWIDDDEPSKWSAVAIFLGGYWARMIEHGK